MDNGFSNPAFNLQQMSQPRQDMSAQMTQQQQKKPWWTALISELGGAGGAAGGAEGGAALGTALLPGVGTLIGGGLGAALGGFLGGTGGKAVEQKIRDNQNFLGAGGSARKSFTEGGVDAALSGAGQVGGDVLQGLKAAKGGGSFVEGAAADAPSLLQRMSQATKSSGTGALDTKAGIQGIADQAERLGTVNQYKISSGLRGLNQTSSLIDNLDNKIVPLLKDTKVPVSDVFSAIDQAAKTTFSPTADSPAMLENIKNVVLNHSNGDTLNGDSLRSIRSELGSVFQKNSTTPLSGLQKDIYHALGNTLGEASPDARALIAEQGKLFNVADGLKNTAGGAKIPIPFVGGKTVAGGVVRDFGKDIGANLLGKAGAITANPVTANLVRQAPASLMRGLSGAQPQNPQTMLQAPDSSSPQSLLSGGQDATGSLLGQANQGSDVTSQLLGQPQQLQTGGPSMDSLKQAIAQDIQQTGGKNMNNLMQLGQLYGLVDHSGSPAGAKLTTDQQKTVDSANEASATLDTMLSQLGQLGGGAGRVGGLLGTIEGKVGLNNNVHAFNSTKTDTAIALAKAYSGSARIPSKEQLQSIEQSMPNYNDNPQEAQRKVDLIKQRLSAKLGSIPGGGAASNISNGQGLLSQLNGY